MTNWIAITFLIIGLVTAIIMLVWLIPLFRLKATHLILTREGLRYQCPNRFKTMITFITILYVTSIASMFMMETDFSRRLFISLLGFWFFIILIPLYFCRYRSYLFINSEKIEYRVIWKIRTINKYDIAEVCRAWGHLFVKLKSGKRMNIPNIYYMEDTGLIELIKDLKALADCETATQPKITDLEPEG